MVLFEIIGQYEVLDIFKCLSRKQLVTFAISARCFAQLSASAAIHSVHLVSNFRGAVKLAGSSQDEDKEMFLALQNALQYEETRMHYRIVGQLYNWKRIRDPHPDQLPFIRQCFPLMSGGLCIMTQNYKVEEGWHLEVASKLDFFRGACTEVIFDLGCFGQHWHQMLTHPTVLAARKLYICQKHALISNSADLVNWLWQPFAVDGNAANDGGLGGASGPGWREMTLHFMYMEELVENIAGMLKQKFEFSLENDLPLPNFLLRFTKNQCFYNQLRQFSIKSIQKMVDSKNNVVAKFEFTNCTVDNNSFLVNQSWEIRQFYGQMENEEEINQQEKRQKTDEPVTLLVNYCQEGHLSNSDLDSEEGEEDSSDSDSDIEEDSSDSDLDIEEEDDENIEEEIEDNGNKQQ